MLTTALVFSLAASPEVAVLSSRGDLAELRFQPVGTPELSAPVARFTHAEGSAVKGSLLPRSRVVVASATLRSGGDLSFANSLIRLEAGKGPRVLADQLVYGSRPLMTAEGRVFVSRGVAGLEPMDGRDALRVDALTIEEIDPVNATRRVVHSSAGYLLFLAGAWGRELIIYEVAPVGARLISVHVDTFAVRELLHTMAPLARDFVVDAPRHRVLFTQGAEARWFVEQVDLLTLASSRLAEGAEVTLMPAVLADGRVLINGGAGLFLEGAPAIPGFSRLVFQQKNLIVGLHLRPSEFPLIFALKDGVTQVLIAPPDSRLDVAGVIP